MKYSPVYLVLLLLIVLPITVDDGKRMTEDPQKILTDQSLNDYLYPEKEDKGRLPASIKAPKPYRDDYIEEEWLKRYNNRYDQYPIPHE